LAKAQDAWTRPLWPVHLKPLPDELLSSWLVRLACAHGLKVQTFSRLLAGSSYQIWNRDIDRNAPQWLLDALCRNTATSAEDGFGTTLKAYEGKLYRSYHESYLLQWILPLQIRRFKRIGYGLQFCPGCLVEDVDPYFRRRWRVAFYTWCSQHNAMLHDRCPSCGASVNFHRRDLGHPHEVDGGSLVQCHACDFDYRDTPLTEPVFYEESARRVFELAVQGLEQPSRKGMPDLQYLNVLHHLCRMMHVQYRNVRLAEFACRVLGVPGLQSRPELRTFDLRQITERHHMMQLGFWYMADLRNRLTVAWHDGKISYSALLRDFEDRPKWFDLIVCEFEDWRQR